MAEGSAITADGGMKGDGGTVKIIADDHADFNGTVSAKGGSESGKGGFVETSGLGSIAVDKGMVDTRAADGTAGTWLIDPTTITIISSGPPASFVPSTNSSIGLQQILTALLTSNVTVATSGGNTGNGDIIFDSPMVPVGGSYERNATPNAAMRTLTFDADNDIIFTENVTIKSLGTLVLEAEGKINFSTGGIFLTSSKADSVQTGNLHLNAPTIDLHADFGASGAVTSTATTINIFDGGSIQDGVDLTAVGGTVSVAAGTYAESVNVYKTLTLLGANAGLEGADEMRGPETMVTPNSPGFYITADGVILDGFMITGADNGVLVEGADGVKVRNNVIEGATVNGILFRANSDDGVIKGNLVTDSKTGIRVTGGSNAAKITDNTVTGGLYGIVAGSATERVVDNNVSGTSRRGITVISSPDVIVSRNIVSDTGRQGIWVNNSVGASLEENEITGADLAGIDVTGSDGASLTDNIVTGSGGHGISVSGSGGTITLTGNVVHESAWDAIHVEDFENAVLGYNEAVDTGDDGIEVVNGDTVSLYENYVQRAGFYADNADEYGADGIHVRNVDGVEILPDFVGKGYGDENADTNIVDNEIAITLDDGIEVRNGNVAYVAYNLVGHAGDDGIAIRNTDIAEVTGNAVSMTGGEGIYIRSRNGNSSYAGVFDNRVLLAGGNGILISGIDGESDVPLRLLGAEGHGDYGWSVNVDGNDVAMMAKNGIYVRNSGPVRIANNDTFMTGMGDELTGTIEFVNGLASGTIAPAFGPPTKSFFGPRFTWNWGDGDGIRVEDIEGTGPLGLTVEIVDNDVAASGGHGIFAGDIDGVTIIGGNTVSDSGLDITKIKGYSSLGSLLTKGPFDDESGFFGTGDNLPTRRDLWSGQDMTDVLMSYVPAPYSVEYDGHDGIHVHDVYGSSYENTGHNLYVVGNTVNGSGDDGVEIHEASASLLVSGNTITDSGLGNTGERGGDAIHIRDIEPASGDAPEGYVSGGSEEGYSGYAVNVTGNMIDNTQDDGIEILNAPSVYVATNILSDIGSAGHGLLDFIFGSGNDNADGIHIGNVGQNTRDAKVEISGEIHGGPYIDPFAVVVDANEIYTASDDGIEVLDSGRTRISGNTIEDVGAAGDRSGGDGIHVAGISNGFHISPGISEVGPYGYAVEITGNTVDGTGDDGIEVLDSESALIDTNHIYNVGYGYGWNGLLDFFFNHGFHDNADAIHVEDVHGGEYSGTTIDENVEEYAVLVTNNEIEHASDDGIEIEDAGRTRIASNTIMDVGFGNPSRSGGDGIHVRNVYADGYGPFSGPKLLGALEDGDVYSVEIVGNRVDTVADDGIQILWSGNVLVDSNQISNTGHEGGVDQWGADGIHILNGWLDGDYKEPYFLITSADVTNNTVTAAGDDGIDIEGVSSLLVDTNTISGALDDGIAVLGYAGFGASEPSQPEEGPFEEIFLVGDSEGPVEELPPFVFVVTNNDVSDSGADGIQVEGFDALDLSDNTVSGSLLNGVLISGAYNGYAGFQGNTLTDNPVGARFESGLIDMSDLTRPNLVNSGGVGGRVGYQFDVADLENPAGLALVNNTFGSTEFTGFTDLGSFYIRLENGSFLSGGAPVLLNGLFASYDTIVPASFPGLSLPPSTLKFIEDRLFDADDALVNGRGQIFTGFPQTAGLDNIEDFFSKFGAFGGSQRGVNVTINGLPPVQLSANNLGGITPFAGGPEDIEPAAGEEEGGEPQNPQDIEPAAGGEEVSCWSESANAAASGQSSTYSFGGADPEADLSATANCGSRAL